MARNTMSYFPGRLTYYNNKGDTSYPQGVGRGDKQTNPQMDKCKSPAGNIKTNTKLVMVIHCCEGGKVAKTNVR